MQSLPKSTAEVHDESAQNDAERRSDFRGNAQFDLCNLLETVRRRDQLKAVALCDSTGLVLAGAGRYQDCEELSAQAANDVRAVSAELEVEGTRLLLSAAGRQPGGLEAQAATELRSACERILSRPKKALSSLLGT